MKQVGYNEGVGSNKQPPADQEKTMTQAFGNALCDKVGTFFALHILGNMEFSEIERIENDVEEFPAKLEDYLEPYVLLDRAAAARHVGMGEDVSDDVLFALMTESDDCVISDNGNMTFVVIKS